VTFTVTQNLPPVSAGDAYAVNEDGSLSVAAPGVLGNDSDPGGGAADRAAVSGPAHGTLTLNPNGSFTYTPAANYNGPDGFSYRASDGVNLGDAVAVTLTVKPGQRRPGRRQRQLQHGRGRRVDGRGVGVLGNDTDADGDALRRITGQRAKPRRPELPRRRFVHLHAERQLQRQRQLHLQGE